MQTQKMSESSSRSSTSLAKTKTYFRATRNFAHNLSSISSPQRKFKFKSNFSQKFHLRFTRNSSMQFSLRFSQSEQSSQFLKKEKFKFTFFLLFVVNLLSYFALISPAACISNSRKHNKHNNRSIIVITRMDFQYGFHTFFDSCFFSTRKRNIFHFPFMCREYMEDMLVSKLIVLIVVLTLRDEVLRFRRAQ